MFRKTNEGLRWAVPKTARRYLTMTNHDTKGHFTLDKTLSLMRGLYWFPGMRHCVRRYKSTCLPCLYNKEPSGKRPGYLHPFEKVSEPMHTLHIDHLGPFVESKMKNAYPIVAVDAFTKFVFMKAVVKTKEIHVEKFLNMKVFSIFGTPTRIISDRGACFTSRKFKDFCHEHGIELIQNATTTPRANGQVERYNRSILAAISATCSDEERWDNGVDNVCWGLNTTSNKATGKSPFMLLFSYVPRRVDDAFVVSEVVDAQRDTNLAQTRMGVKERLEDEQDRAKERYDRRRCKPKDYLTGQLVLVRRVCSRNGGKSKKLLPKYDGPCLIQRVLDNDRYVVVHPKGSTRS